MGARRFLLLSFSAILAWALSACEIVDDQTVIPHNRRHLADPVPTERNHARVQKKHRILMAAIDSGVDYKHPLLQDHVHFQLDEKSQPVGFGWDYLGNDPWAGPVLVRTEDIDPNVSLELAQTSRDIRALIAKAIQDRPALAEWMHPDRLHEVEADMYHGTHVAGLMVYDRPELGLLSYRVLPLSDKVDKGPLRSYPSILSRTYEILAQSIERAHQDGVRVANMSLGFQIEDECVNKGLDHEDCPEFHREGLRRLQEAVRSAKNLIVVVAAGNHGEAMDSRKMLPCGIEAPNLVCVGALSSRQKKADFSNTPLGHRNLIWAPGVDVLSLMSTNFCHESNFADLKVQRFQGDDGPALWTQFLDQAEKSCRETQLLARSSGTSMASPLIARALGKILIENSKLTPAAAIDELKRSSLPIELEGVTYQRFEVDVPSWMGMGDIYIHARMGSLGKISKQRRAFEFYFDPRDKEI